MNKFVGAGILGVLGFGVYKLFGMKTMYDKMGTALYNPRIHKVDLKGIAFRSEIKITNPTRFTMTISKPVITVTTNGKFISENAPEQKVYDIKTQGTTIIDTIEIPISWITMAGYIKDVAKKIPTLIALKTYDLKSIIGILQIPIEMKYSLYVGSMFFQSEPQKLV